MNFELAKKQKVGKNLRELSGLEQVYTWLSFS